MATILHVDDEPAIGLILQDTLQRAGHHPVGARSVPEALHLLERGGVDLVISDYRMPGLTGLEFLSLDVGEAERVLLARALEVAGRNRTRAAELLGMSVRTLRNKLNLSRTP